MSEAIELYLRQIKLTHSIPFEIRIPNNLTQKTFEKTDKELELNYHNSPKDMFDKLGN